MRAEHETKYNRIADTLNHPFDQPKSHESYDLVPGSAYYMKNPEFGLIIVRLSNDSEYERKDYYNVVCPSEKSDLSKI